MHANGLVRKLVTISERSRTGRTVVEASRLRIRADAIQFLP